jgi:hypothetical protein
MNAVLSEVTGKPVLIERRYHTVFQRSANPRRRLSVTFRREGFLIGTDGDKASFLLYPVPIEKPKDSE